MFLGVAVCVGIVCGSFVVALIGGERIPGFPRLLGPAFRTLLWNPYTKVIIGRMMRHEGLKLLVEAEFVDSSEFFIRECGVGQGSNIVENLLWF